MRDKIFFVNSGSLIINDPVQVFNNNDYFILNNVLDGCYTVKFAYNYYKVITFVEVVNVNFEFVDLNSILTDDVNYVFCISTMLGIFDNNFYLENVATQESQNKFYDLCCHVTSGSDGCDVIDNASFVWDCFIGDYQIHTAIYDDKIIGIRIYLVKNFD